MDKPKNNRRGRRAPSGEPRLTSPLPLTTQIECVVDEDAVVAVCSITHPQHLQQHHHITHITRVLTEHFGVIGASSLIQRYTIETVSQALHELLPAYSWNGMKGITNPGGFFVWKVREIHEAKLAAESQPDSQPKAHPRRLHAVGDSDIGQS